MSVAVLAMVPPIFLIVSAATLAKVPAFIIGVSVATLAIVPPTFLVVSAATLAKVSAFI